MPCIDIDIQHYTLTKLAFSRDVTSFTVNICQVEVSCVPLSSTASTAHSIKLL